MPKRPNIVVCMCDQLRAHAVGCYGNPLVRTPNIDRLAAEGVRFDHAVTNNPVCTPARSTLISGQYARTCTGMLGNVHENPPNPRRVRLLDPTLAEVLAGAGYRTGLIGKWHMDPQPQLVGFQSAIYPKIEHRYYGQTYYDEQARPFRVDEFGGYYELQRARQFLREARHKPFFLFYNISLPHQPIGRGHMPEEYVEMYEPQEVPLRDNTLVDGERAHDRWWFKVYTDDAFYWRWREQQLQPESGELDERPEWLPDDFNLRHLTALYYGAITCVDDLLGGLLDALDEYDLTDDTIVVFVSDHGDNLGSHGLFNKNSLIEESIRIPLIVRHPAGLPPRKSPRHLAAMVDIMPTVLDLAGLAVPRTVQGRSLLPAMRGEQEPPGADPAFVETGTMLGVRTLDWLYGTGYDAQERRLVARGSDADEPWLYNLRDDPLELHNLAGDPAHSEVQERLHTRLVAWDRQTPYLDLPAS